MAQLTKTERKEISYYLSKNYGPTEIGRLLNRDKSVISREIKRNSVKGKYDPDKAHMKSYQRRYWVMSELPKIRNHPELIGFIELGLNQKNPWSPEQIAGRWNLNFAPVFGYKITHPTIYNYLYKDRPSLCKKLCTKRYKRKKRRKKSNRVMISDRTWIEARPAIVDQRHRLGDWEGDTICSVKGDKTSFLVLHDRASRFISVSKSCDKTKKRITSKVKQLLKDKPKHTLTVDNGLEFKGHKAFGVDTYFCQPYSSWQKGAVEYSNRLIRRHFPKKTVLKHIHQKKLASIILAINNTPRKCLNFRTPAEVFSLNSPLLTS